MFLKWAGSVQEVSRKCSGSVQEVCKKCSSSVQEVCREGSASVQEVFREGPGGIQEVFRNCSTRVQEVFREGSASVQEVCREAPGGIQEVYRKCSRSVQELFNEGPGRGFQELFKKSSRAVREGLECCWAYPTPEVLARTCSAGCFAGVPGSPGAKTVVVVRPWIFAVPLVLCSCCRHLRQSLKRRRSEHSASGAAETQGRAMTAVFAPRLPGIPATPPSGRADPRHDSSARQRLLH